jgi:hypothetical protein
MSALAYVAIDIAPLPVVRARETAGLMQPMASPPRFEPSDELDALVLRVEHVMTFDLQS